MPALFFPAMMAVIGSRYLIFATVYGTAIFWTMGAALIAAAIFAFCLAIAPASVAGLGGVIEAGFAVFVFMRAARPAVVQ